MATFSKRLPWRDGFIAAVIAGGLLGCGGGGSSDGGQQTSQTPNNPEISSVAWSLSPLVVERDVFATGPVATTTISLSLKYSDTYWYSYTYNKNFAFIGRAERTADRGLDFDITINAFPVRPVGSYSENLSVRLCYDEACAREAKGSPFTLPMRLDVGYFARAETGVEPLVPSQTTVLNHNVVGAVYSSQLDTVVTISTQPDSTLRLHNLQSGKVRLIPLASVPTSLSLSADGQMVAVGHDAAVSLFDLRAESPTPVKRFDVPIPVGSLVLANGLIVAMEAKASGWASIYWIDTSSGKSSRFGTSTNSVGIYGVAGGILHPAGDRIYMADSGLSPDDIWRMDLSGDAATGKSLDSRYHGDFQFCNRLAVAPNGLRIYTGCGTILSSASSATDDMLYAGTLNLSSSEYNAASLSVAPNNKSIAFLEQHKLNCDPRLERLDQCYSRISIHDAMTLERRLLKGLAPYIRNRDRLQQWGRHVMHASDGSLILLTEVRTLAEPVPTWLMHRVSM